MRSGLKGVELRGFRDFSAVFRFFSKFCWVEQRGLLREMRCKGMVSQTLGELQRGGVLLEQRY